MDHALERHVKNDNKLVCLRVKDEAGHTTKHLSVLGSFRRECLEEESHAVQGITDGDVQAASVGVGTQVPALVKKGRPPKKKEEDQKKKREGTKKGDKTKMQRTQKKKRTQKREKRTQKRREHKKREKTEREDKKVRTKGRYRRKGQK